MKAFIISLTRKLFYLVSAIIIFAAILITVTRILSPVLEGHRREVEAWATKLLNSPVAIRNIDLAWYQYQPEITLEDVILINKNTKKPSLEIQKIRVFFSIPKSIWYRKPVLSGVMISGTSLHVQQNEKGDFTVRGLPSLPSTPQLDGNESKFTDVMDWLSTQAKLVLTNIDIHYTSSNKQAKFITIYNLSFVNKPEKHSILGHAVLHQKIPTEINLAVQWYGQNFDLQKIKAKVYLYVSGFLLPQWSQGYAWQDWQVSNGVTSAKIWGTWENNQFQKIQSNFEAFNLALFNQKNKTTHRIYRVSGNLGFKKEANEIVVAGDDLLIDFPKNLWPVTSFYLSLSSNNDKLIPQTLKVGYLRLQELLPFVASLKEDLSKDNQQILSKLKPRGEIENLEINFSPQSATQNTTESTPRDQWLKDKVSASFNHLSIASINNLPSITNAAGSLQWDGEKGNIHLATQNGVFDYGKVFSAPLNIDYLTGDIAVSLSADNQWNFKTNNVVLANKDLDFKANGSMSFQNGVAISDLKANFSAPFAPGIIHYLPLKVFNNELSTWLNKSILAGSIKNGEAELKGKLSDFPFNKQNGTFLVSGDLNDTTLKFSPDWPSIQNINGKLTFAGNGMNASISDAKMLNIPLKNVQATIQDFSAEPSSVLTVKGEEISSDFVKALYFIHHSPLEKSLGKMFAGINFQGPLKLDLGLSIPLKNPDDTQVLGQLYLNDTDMNMTGYGLDLSHINGSLKFTENSAQAENIQGLFFNKPFTLNLTTIRPKKTPIIRANFINNIDIKDLENWLKVSFSNYAEGSTGINGQIDFETNQPMHLHLESNLLGIKLNLPDQYAKEINVKKDFTLDLMSADNQPIKLKMRYANLLSAALLLQNNNGFKLNAVNLNIGNKPADWPKENGLYISGEFDRLDWDKIKEYIDDSKTQSSVKTDLPLRSINVYTKTLTLAKQVFKEMHFEVEPTKDNWDIKINSPDIIGEFQIPTKFNADELITAQFQKINVNLAQDNTKQSVNIDVKGLPSILFNANQVTINDIPIGQVSFNTSPDDDGLYIRSLRIQSPRVKLQARGNWSQKGKEYTSHLVGNLKSVQVSQLLKSFGVNVSNFVATNGELNFDLDWNAAPFEASLANINGNASLKLGQGRIIDLGKESNAKMDIGKMLSIFSLQTLPRRLNFDFSDISQKGYSFDSVKGDFRFRNGSVYTNNFKIEGPVAGVSVNGRIGFKEKDYSLNLSVTPYVTSSLPVAATLLTGQPLVGLAAYAVNSLLTKATTHYYVVTGPWNNPQWRPAS